MFESSTPYRSSTWSPCRFDTGYLRTTGWSANGVGTSNWGTGVDSAVWASSNEASLLDPVGRVSPYDSELEAVASLNPVDWFDLEQEAFSKPNTPSKQEADLDDVLVSVRSYQTWR